MALKDFWEGGSDTRSMTMPTGPATQTQQMFWDVYGPTIGKGQNVYGDPRVAGLNPYQEQAMDLGGFAGQFTPGSTIPMYGQTGTALSGLLAGEMGAEPYSSADVNRFYQEAYEKPAWQDWQSQIQPAVREAYAGPGFWSTGRMNAEVESAQDVQDWLGEMRGGLDWQAIQANKALQESAANRALSAVGAGMEYGQIPTQTALAQLAGRGEMYNLASMEQMQEQREIDAAIQRFIEENRLTDPENMAILEALMNMQFSYSKGHQRAPIQPPDVSLTGT